MNAGVAMYVLCPAFQNTISWILLVVSFIITDRRDDATNSITPTTRYRALFHNAAVT